MSEPEGSTPNDFLALGAAILTISDTRGPEEDRSGDTLEKFLVDAGHEVRQRGLVRDEPDAIQSFARSCIADPSIHVLVTTGGTGITARDRSPETLDALFERSIPGFGELFRQLSYAEIGASTIQSRAIAGIAGRTLIFVLPGSTGACRLAMESILIPQLDRRTKPCNFAQLLPRL